MNAARFLVASVLVFGLYQDGTAYGQDVPRIIIDVGGLYSIQQSPTIDSGDPSIPKPGVGGSAFGLIAGVAAPAARTADFGIELSLPARFEALQTMNYGPFNGQYSDQHRDLIVSVVVRFHVEPVASKRIQVEAVCGPAIVWESTVQTAVLANDIYKPNEISRLTLGVTGGVNLVFPVRKRMSVMPGLRVHWISRDSSLTESFSALLGLDSFVWRPSIALRTSF